MRKNPNGEGKIKKERQTQRVTGRYGSNGPLIPLLIEGGQPAWPTEGQFNWKKEAVRKNWNGGGKTKRRGKLTAAAFCRQVAGRYGSDVPLIPLLTEGGRPARPTEEQFNWKKEAVRKNRNGGGKTKRRGELTVTSFSMKLVSKEWRQRDLIPPSTKGGRSAPSMD